MLAEPDYGRFEHIGSDRAQFVAFRDQPVLVWNLKFVEEADEQRLTADEVQGHQQRRGQRFVGPHDPREVVDAPVHREFAYTGIAKSEGEAMA